jgi:hypothetical protein
VSLSTRLRRSAGEPPATGDETDRVEHTTVVATGAKRRRHPWLAGVLTGLACILVLSALIAPNTLGNLTPEGFVRIPVEALLFAVFLLLLPSGAVWIRRGAAILAGVGLGLLTILKLLDMGFYATLNRPFDALLDFPLAGNALDFLKDSIGSTGAIAVAVGIVVLIILIMVLMTLSVLRLAPLLIRNPARTRRAVAVLAVLWVALAVLGAEIVPHTPVASRSAAAITISHALQIPVDLRDAREFDKVSKIDAFRNTPSDQLLTGLRGKDVVLTFVESYGRSAIESPDLAPEIDTVLDDGSRRLRAAGFASRSGFLTSPTAGGGSWLAQSTLLSGLWVKNQGLYNKFIASDRMTLNGAFRRADWRTLAVAPGVKKDWPEARVFGFDKIYDADGLKYRGPRFSWSRMPDQYVLSYFERTEHSKQNRAPMMVEMPLTSSHMPWTPLPKLVDWNAVGDGSVFNPMSADKSTVESPYADPVEVRKRYRESIKYTMSTLISYLEKYGDDNLVMVILGDHQPFPLVAGNNASHDVPISIVAKDPAVLDRISGWKWQDGLNPNPKAPVWRMDTFRDRFLTAYGPEATAGKPNQAGKPSSAPSPSQLSPSPSPLLPSAAK